MIERLPSALESERQVLGTAMLGEDLANAVVSQMQVDDFYSNAHRELFTIIQELSAAHASIDPLVVMQKLKARRASPEELLEVRDMAAEVLTPTGFKAHVRRVQDKAMLRQMMQLGQHLVEKSSQEDADPDEIAQLAESIVFQSTERRISGAEVPWATAVGDVLDRLEYMSKVSNPVLGVPMGYAEVDFRLHGLQEGHFYIVAARPGSGKTSFVTGAAMHAASLGHHVAFFSLEMSAQELAQRMVCVQADVSFTRIRANRVKPDEWGRIVDATGHVSALPIHVFDAGINTVLDMNARARRIKDLKLVVVDYVQLARHHKRTSSKNEEVSEISRALKLMARQLGVPVLACAQLNREVETRKGRPRLSDLRDSGALEQDADVVMFLHRDSDESVPPGGAPVELITAKHRNGEAGIDRLKWVPEVTVFRDLPFQERQVRR